MQRKHINDITLGLFTALLGAVCGTVIWLFLKAMGLCTDLIWTVIPEQAGSRFTPVLLCAAGGFAAGLLRRKCGDYPEELPVVLGKIRKNRHYEYDRMPVMLLSAFLPLVFGASVGPEAGLTGVIAGLCYWTGDNVRYAGEHAEAFSEIGAAVTLGSLFHIPLFGIFAVEENPEDGADGGSAIPKTSKLVLYGLSIAGAFLAMKALGSLFGAAGEGMPSYEYYPPNAADYLLLLLYIPAGLLLQLAFGYAEKLTGKAAALVPGVLRETLCGVCIGAAALLVPAVLFSGEEQMAELPERFLEYGPAALLGLCLLKIFMTALCIRSGLKGGHFFPLIFACSCMGFGLASLFFGDIAGITDAAVLTGHAVFAAAAVTAATLGAQLKKPLAVSLLLLLCFPVRLILWTVLAAAIGSRISGRQKAADL